MVHLGIEQGWFDGVDEDVLAAEFVGGGFGEGIEGAFGGAIGGGGGVVFEGGADVDDAAVASLDHAGEDGADEEERAAEVGGEGLVPVHDVNLVDGGFAGKDTGVVDEDMNGAAFEEGFLNGGGDLDGDGDVGGAGPDGGAEVAAGGGGLFEAVAPAAEEGKAGAAGGEPEGERTTESGAGAGDEGGAVGEVHA